MMLFHLGTIAALFMFSWKALAVSLFLWWVAGSLGVGMGYHRLLTHQRLQNTESGGVFLNRSVERWPSKAATSTGSSRIAFTTRIRKCLADPHTPRDGGWWAHMGWILRGTSQQHSDAVMWRYAPDLMKDRVHFWLNKFYFVPLIVCGIVLLAVGGWSMLLWGIFLRVTVALHMTWLVNSATHMWGTRRFETNDDSTNSWWVALLTFGEGWHNNHHAHPRAARHGLTWYEIDINWWGIRTLQFLGLAKDIKLISKAQMRARNQSPSLFREQRKEAKVKGKVQSQAENHC